MRVATAPSSRARGGQPHLKLVRRRSRNLIRRARARKVAPVAIIGAIVATTLFFGILLERVVLSQSAFRQWDIRTQLESEQERHEELLLDAARLGSPGRIERYARNNLGMVDPQAIEYIVADVPIRDRGLAARVPARGSTTMPPGAPASAQGLNP